MLSRFLRLNILVEVMPNDPCFTTFPPTPSPLNVSRHSPNPRMTVTLTAPSSSSQMTQVFPGCCSEPDMASHHRSSSHITKHCRTRCLKKFIMSSKRWHWESPDIYVASLFMSPSQWRRRMVLTGPK